MNPFRSVVALLVLELMAPGPRARAAWTPNGVPLAPARSAQDAPRSIPDDAGGTIVVWQDARSCSTSADIYAQRLDGAGNPVWAVDGVPVCQDAAFQKDPQVVRDLAGGAIVVWVDNRASNYDIYAQRIDASGNTLWAPGGVPICTEPSTQWFGYLPAKNQMVVSDGAGGALVVWLDYRAFDPPHVYSQHVNSTGATVFIPNGIPVCPASTGAEDVTLCSNAAGGAIVTWSDFRAPYIFAQNLSPVGTLLWAAPGAPVSAGTNSRAVPQIDQDGAGGAVIAWLESLDASNSDI